MLSSEKAPLIKEMYRDWDTFRTTVDLVEMVLTKSEPAIAKHYDETLVTDPSAKDLGLEVRGLHIATEQAILELTGHSMLGENNLILQRAMAVRNPVSPSMNITRLQRAHGSMCLILLILFYSMSIV